MKTFNVETKAWSQNKTVALPITTGSYIAPYLTAVFNQFAEDDDEIFDYVTYLSWGDGNGGYLAELKDGEIIRDGEKPRYVYSTDWKSVNTKRGPSLGDLTHDYLAVVVNKTSTRSYYQKYYKDSHTPDPSGLIRVPYESPQEESWAPTGVAYSKKVADADSPSGFRMDTNFYAFVANNSVAKATRWQFVNCEALGYWMPNSLTGTDIDLNDIDDSESSFELWPLLGIVDMPPYVENGHECELSEWDKCGTYVELSWAKSTEEGLSVDFSIGPYYRTRARNPVEVEAGAGYALSFEDSTKKTYTHI
jgi:hypothetical protein